MNIVNDISWIDIDYDAMQLIFRTKNGFELKRKKYRSESEMENAFKVIEVNLLRYHESLEGTNNEKEQQARLETIKSYVDN